MPKVSVIVTNYNHAPFLRQRLESIFSQTFQDFEVILLDDCSTDNSLEILKEYSIHPKVSHFIINEINSGSPFKQWKKGIELAKGEYIWIAESDDWAANIFLETLVTEMDKNTNIGLSFCSNNWIDTNNQIGVDLSLHHADFLLDGRAEILKYLVYYNNIQNVSSVLMRKYNIKSDSEFANYKSCGDWIFYIDFLSDCYIYYIDKKLNNFRWFHDNISNRSEKSGVWVDEGIDVLKISKKYVQISFSQKLIISRFWIQKIRESYNSTRKKVTLKNISKVINFCVS